MISNFIGKLWPFTNSPLPWNCLLSQSIIKHQYFNSFNWYSHFWIFKLWTSCLLHPINLCLWHVQQIRLQTTIPIGKQFEMLLLIAYCSLRLLSKTTSTLLVNRQNMVVTFSYRMKSNCLFIVFICRVLKGHLLFRVLFVPCLSASKFIFHLDFLHIIPFPSPSTTQGLRHVIHPIQAQPTMEHSNEQKK